MKRLLFAAVLLAAGFTAKAQMYVGSSSKVQFFSYTAVENIDATSSSATTVLNTATNQVACEMKIKDFKFKNGLMEEHFNENYMESDKYPKASFRGKINETVDYTKDGTTSVTMTGDLTIHGVAKPRTINATVTVKGETITVDSKFAVTVKDHNITVPEAMGAKIATVVSVTMHTEMKKKQ